MKAISKHLESNTDELFQYLNEISKYSAYVKSLLVKTKVDQPLVMSSLKNLSVMNDDLQTLIAEIEMGLVLDNLENFLNQPRLSVVK